MRAPTCAGDAQIRCLGGRLHLAETVVQAALEPGSAVAVVQALVYGTVNFRGCGVVGSLGSRSVTSVERLEAGFYRRSQL